MIPSIVQLSYDLSFHYTMEHIMAVKHDALLKIDRYRRVWTSNPTPQTVENDAE